MKLHAVALGGSCGKSSQVLAFCAVVVALIVFQNASSDGLLRDWRVTSAILDEHAGQWATKVNCTGLDGKYSGAILVDARDQLSYERQHIPNAVSIPLNFDNDQLRAVVHDISIDQSLIVYCSSAKCLASEEMASRLIRAGYRNVSILEGGFDEWLKSKERE